MSLHDAGSLCRLSQCACAGLTVADVSDVTHLWHAGQGFAKGAVDNYPVPLLFRLATVADVRQLPSSKQRNKQMQVRCKPISKLFVFLEADCFNTIKQALTLLAIMHILLGRCHRTQQHCCSLCLRAKCVSHATAFYCLIS